jgi:hypothetical protein
MLRPLRDHIEGGIKKNTITLTKVSVPVLKIIIYLEYKFKSWKIHSKN